MCPSLYLRVLDLRMQKATGKIQGASIEASRELLPSRLVPRRGRSLTVPKEEAGETRAGEEADYVVPLTTVIMLVAAIVIAISISLFAVIVSPLFLIAALLAFLDRHKREETIIVQTTQGR
jgi:hypothetical protein